MPALTFTSLVHSYDNVDRNSYTFTPTTPTANRLVIAIITSRIGASAVKPTSVSGNGITYTFLIEEATSGTVNLSVWYGFTASPSAGNITIDYNGVTQTGCAINLVQIANMLLTGANGVNGIANSKPTAYGAATSSTFTMKDFQNTQNGTLHAHNISSNEAITGDGSMTSLGNDAGATPANSLLTEYAAGNVQSIGTSWTTSGATRGIGIEIRHADALPGTIPEDW